jgi:hypothetical protein
MEVAAGDGRLRQRGQRRGGIEEAAVGVVVAEKRRERRDASGERRWGRAVRRNTAAAAVRSRQKGRTETRESGLGGSRSGPAAAAAMGVRKGDGFACSPGIAGADGRR